jgi:Tyrosinase co-factor MelC1
VSDIDRRTALRLGVLGLSLAGAAIGTARIAAGAATTPGAGSIIDEIYRGRHILAFPPILPTDLPRAYIDGLELHVMALSDGRYVSVMDHYRPFPTLRDAARAAVDNLRGAALVPHS